MTAKSNYSYYKLLVSNIIECELYIHSHS